MAPIGMSGFHRYKKYSSISGLGLTQRSRRPARWMETPSCFESRTSGWRKWWSGWRAGASPMCGRTKGVDAVRREMGFRRQAVNGRAIEQGEKQMKRLIGYFKDQRGVETLEWIVVGALIVAV